MDWVDGKIDRKPHSGFPNGFSILNDIDLDYSLVFLWYVNWIIVFTKTFLYNNINKVSFNEDPNWEHNMFVCVT